MRASSGPVCATSESPLPPSLHVPSCLETHLPPSFTLQLILEPPRKDVQQSASRGKGDFAKKSGRTNVRGSAWQSWKLWRCSPLVPGTQGSTEVLRVTVSEDEPRPLPAGYVTSGHSPSRFSVAGGVLQWEPLEGFGHVLIGAQQGHSTVIRTRNTGSRFKTNDGASAKPVKLIADPGHLSSRSLPHSKAQSLGHS